MRPHRYVEKEWATGYIKKALKLSREAWHEYMAHGTRSTVASTRKLFLICGPTFRLQGGRVLVESEDTGEKWGENEFMVDLWSAADKELLLERAASFGGSLYLVEHISEEVENLWAALRHAGSSSPHTLFFLGGQRGFLDADDLLNILLHIGPHVENVALYHFHIRVSVNQDASFGDKLPIPLHTLHLQSVEGSCFLESLERLFCVSHTLSLVNIKSGLSFPVSDTFEIDEAVMKLIGGPDRPKFLEWKLTRLNLEYCLEQRIDLASFMNALGKCPHKTLCSLSLRGSVSTPSNYDLKRTASFVGVVIDALHKSGLQFLDLDGFEQEPSIQAQLLRNRCSRTHQLLQDSKVSAVAIRLFTCGDSLAGKTTLLSTLSNEGSHMHVLDKLKAKVMSQISPPNMSKRTRGIEIHTIVKHNIRLSLWDMAGETEFHAFHDHMFPDPSSSHGSPSMFMFVWSPVHAKNAKKGKLKTPPEFESSFGYWLRFINSKTRQSNTKCKVIVVFTRWDQTKLVRDAMKSSIDALKAAFSNTIEVVDVLEVDARSKASVEPLNSSIFQAAQDVLKGVEVYSICSQVSEHLLKRHNQKASVGSEQPIISWNDFSELCSSQFYVADPEVQKAIAYSLNESGDIIHLSNLDYLVLDPNWFCNEVMGSLIHFSRPGNSRRVILPIDGYVEQDYLEKLLEESSHSTVVGSVLVAFMEAMHLCCKVPEDPRGRVFVPALLLESSTSEHLQWRGAVSGRSTTQVYVGRRLECDKKDLTFLTRGLFPTIQVLFNRAFYEKKYDKKLGKPDVQAGKGFMSVCMQENEILVEWGLANGEHVIDVIMRAPDDEDAGYTLAYMEEKEIKTVIAVCAQPVGNQGVRLVEAVIRPDCLHSPSPLHGRACALILDLKQELREQLEGGRRHEKLLHLWGGNSDLQLHSVTSHFMDLLGPKEFMQVLKSYKASLEEVFLMQDPIAAASTSSYIARKLEVVAISTDSQDGDNTRGMREGITEETSEVKVDEHEQVVDALSKSMVNDVSNTVLYRKLQSMDGKLVGLQQSACSIGTKVDGVYKSIEDIRCRALPKVQSLVEQSLNFALENEAGKVPRFVFLTTDDKLGIRKKMVTTLFRGLKNVQIELFCEHRERPHRVEGQTRFSVSTVDDRSMFKQALPYVNGFLKVLTLAAKVGAHVLAGAGSTIPDFSKLVALAADTPGFLDNQGFLATTSTLPEEDFNGWQQWLVSVLEKNGGMTESNIASKFMLRRACYKDTLKVAWLCGMHYKDQCPLPLV